MVVLNYYNEKFDWLFIVDPIWLVWNTYISHWLTDPSTQNILDAPTKRYFFLQKNNSTSQPFFFPCNTIIPHHRPAMHAKGLLSSSLHVLQAYGVLEWTHVFTSALRSSPPDRASSCAAVTSSDISIPDIFCTTSFRTSRSKLFPALSWFATYCRRPVSSMEYLRKTVPQNTAKPEKQRNVQIRLNKTGNKIHSWCCAKDVLLESSQWSYIMGTHTLYGRTQSELQDIIFNEMLGIFFQANIDQVSI